MFPPPLLYNTSSGTQCEVFPPLVYNTSSGTQCEVFPPPFTIQAVVHSVKCFPWPYNTSSGTQCEVFPLTLQYKQWYTVWSICLLFHLPICVTATELRSQTYAQVSSYIQKNTHKHSTIRLIALVMSTPLLDSVFTVPYQIVKTSLLWCQKTKICTFWLRIETTYSLID